MKRDREERRELAGQIWGIVGTLFDAALRILLLVAIVYFIYQGALKCYDYGYRIFTETPISATSGKDITITIPTDFTVKELGELFEEKGLSRDKYLLMLQYYCSEYRENVKGGTYTLNTSETAEEMFSDIAEINIAKDELRDSEDNLLTIDDSDTDEESADDDSTSTGGESTDESGTDEGGEAASDDDDENIQEIGGDSDLDDLFEDDVR